MGILRNKMFYSLILANRNLFQIGYSTFFERVRIERYFFKILSFYLCVIRRSIWLQDS